MRGPAVVLFIRIGFLIIAFAGLISAQTSSDTVTLKIVPSSLEMASCDGKSKLLVIVTNGTGRQLTDLELSSFADVPVEVTPALPLALPALGAGQKTSSMFEVKCTATFAPGQLHFVVSSKPVSVGAAVSEIATESVQVKLRAPETIDNIAAIEIKSTLESLTQGTAGDLTITATNKTAQPIQVKIQPQPSESIEFEAKPSANGTVAPADGIQIDAGQQSDFTFTAKAKKRVNPGKQLLVFKVQVRTDGPWRTFLLTREVTVGVLGESEILKLLGVPSLLFLPGFLALTSFGLLWRFRVFRGPYADPNPPLSEKDPGFWVISIILSAILVGIFVAVRHDFLQFYGLPDLLEIWLVSIGVGVVGYLLFKLGERIWQSFMTPFHILRKLSRSGQSTEVRRVQLKGITEFAFVIKVQSNGSAYVCPRIDLVWKKGFVGAARGEVEDQLKSGGDPQIVADTIKREMNQGAASGVFKFDWVRSDPANSSAHWVSKDEIEAFKAADFIVMQEDET
jgi:hypothetical protein